MTFEHVLDAAIEMLRRRGRLTYRTMQRQLGLDDASLADLKHELIVGQRVARDEGGTVLVWDTTAGAAAERRRLTVMFCDLVGSTRLASRLDPEELHEVLGGYRQLCLGVIRRFEGHLAQYLGDGVLAYFGYPVARGEDAERALRAGLEILNGLGPLHRNFNRALGIDVAARIGIDTGLTIVGGHGTDESKMLALGEAPNVAAHIQDRAEPNTVVISETTRRLLGGRFLTQDLGVQALKDVSKPVRLHRVTGEREPGERRARGRTTLIDPGGNLARLRDAWQRVGRGSGELAVVSGEAGIGKSRLIEELRSRVQAESAGTIVFRCSPLYRNSYFYPVASHLRRRLGIAAEAPASDVHARLSALLADHEVEREAAVPLLAALLTATPGDASRGGPALTPQQWMRAMQDSLVDWIESHARRRPVLAVWEDLHWSDPSTRALLARLVRSTRRLPMLTLVSYRPELDPPWTEDAVSTAVRLAPLVSAESEALVRQLAGVRTLPRSQIRRIVEKTDGVPLFIEEMTKAVLESGGPAGQAEGEVPATLYDSLIARLDRLPRSKHVAQVAALLGREFSFELLGAVAGGDDRALRSALGELVEAELLCQEGTPPDARYTFRHALLQDTARATLLRSTREALHRRVAAEMQRRSPAVAEAEPETLAHHLTEAGDVGQAIGYWRRAGERAAARSATSEALAHLDTGLALLARLPESAERDRTELTLQIPRASALRAARGVAAAETGQAYVRACELGGRTGDTARLIPALNGLYAYHMVRAEYEAARAPAEQLLALVRSGDDASNEMIAHRAVGAVRFHTGATREARRHLERAVALYDPARHAHLAVTLGIDHKVAACNFLSLTLFVQGRSNEASDVQRRGLEHARQLEHAHSTAQALAFTCFLLALRREHDAIPPLAEQLIRLAEENAFPLMEGVGNFFLGAARALGPDLHAGLGQMDRGVRQCWATGTRNYRPYFDAVLAAAHARAGNEDEVRALLEQAKSGIEATGERWIEPEIIRMEGELLPPGAGGAAAEACFRRALERARAQGARMWELRAATSLAKLWLEQGREREAAALLRPICRRFDGADLPELRDAQALLERLS